MEDKKYLTVKEFAEQAGIRRQGLYKAYSNPKSKIYPFVRLEGKNVYISKEALTAVYGVVNTADNKQTAKTTQETTKATPAFLDDNKDNPTETTQPTPEVVKETIQQTTKTTPETTQQPPIAPVESQLYTDYIRHLEAEIQRLTEEKEALQQVSQKQQEQIIELSNRVIEISNQAFIIAKQEQHLTYLDKAPDRPEEAPQKRSLLKRLFGKD